MFGDGVQGFVSLPTLDKKIMDLKVGHVRDTSVFCLDTCFEGHFVHELHSSTGKCNALSLRGARVAVLMQAPPHLKLIDVAGE